MKKFLIIAMLFAFPVIAQEDEIPLGCIDFEYYSDLDYYESFTVVKYGRGGAENRGTGGTIELIQDKHGHLFQAFFTDTDVCISTFEQ